MKKLLLLLAAISIIACKEEPKDFVTFSGKITNKYGDSITIRTRDFSKSIALKEDGSFKDTLKVTPGIYNFYDGRESTNIYLQNGYDIYMTLDTEMFDETAKYTGIGSENSNFLAEKSLFEEKQMDKNFDSMTEKELNTSMSSIKTEITEFINGSKNLDTLVINQSLRGVDPMIEGTKGYYASILAIKKDLPKGAPSPTFEGYENINGSKTSMSDLKGKFAYIDVWATWCGPCKAEIPSLKKLEKDYHGKNIAFVSMSIDDDRSHKGSWELANENWKAMVKDKSLGGIQIFAPEGWKSKFITDYKINGIPRFILVDPSGNIVDASAPRPSDPALREMFNAFL
ncbi:TlpA family protein disulfide reductase [Ulvibacter antarcticus]|uniref:Redoxin n=1 Tax=Ulvibacter antarcticus TaxID=442714 RepID=A0A3L9YUL9_9FLAO|nr:TlpA disulfide reductase family protein [Ulvibacter antarcticus]RMA64213.1 redoxin [Ulvibacter antarcticus]